MSALGATGSVVAANMLWNHAWASQVPPAAPKGKSPICVIFTGEPRPDDRDWGADQKQIQAARAKLSEAEEKLGNIKLFIGESRSPEETAVLIEAAGADAPVLAINVCNFAMTRVIQPVLDAARPMLVFALPASGHDWMYVPRWHRDGHRVSLLPTGDYDELERALRILRVVPMMKKTRVLLFPPAQGTAAACNPQEVKRILGADVVAVEEALFDNHIDNANADAVQEEIRAWTQGAKEIIEPNADDIEKAARVSVALDALIREQQADGLAIGTCMGWLPKGFPCLGFTRLRDRGIPAACEGDMDSLLTMLLFQYAFDLAGFQGNATFDTSRNALWTAHCTAPLKMDGPDSEDAPYLLRGHSEVGGSGCVPEVQYRLGQTITRAKFVDLETILASTGTIIEVPERSVHGCRTQIVTEVKDAAAMSANWSTAINSEDAMTLLHRVVVYGDHIDSLKHMANLMGVKVLMEG